MPRGGLRPGTGGARQGAGRPKKEPVPTKEVGRQIRMLAQACRLTPLEYMLGVLNDENADPARRDRMAQAAAPFVHPKAEQPNASKKEQAAAASTAAGVGTEWEVLLN